MATVDDLIEEADGLKAEITREQANGSPDMTFIEEIACRYNAIMGRAARSVHANVGDTTPVRDKKGRIWRLTLDLYGVPSLSLVQPVTQPIPGSQIPVVD